MRRLSIVVLVLLAGCGPSSARVGEFDPYSVVEQGLVVCPSGATVQGLDVSHWNGTINWAQVKASGRDFAIIKATEGTTYVDPTFATHWAGTQANGVYRGAYHFFRPNLDGVQQADHFLSVIGDQTGSLPTMLDIEVTDGQTGATIAAEAARWLTRVHAATGKAPMIYTSPAFWTGSVGSPAGFTQYPLFVANWGVTCPNVPSQWNEWVVWQTTATGTVPGINAQVDLNEFNGSLAALAAWTALPDAGVLPVDAGVRDAGLPVDAGVRDAGLPADAGVRDAGAPDAGRPDAGAPDAGHDGGAPAQDGGDVPLPPPDAGAAHRGGSATAEGGCSCTTVDVPALWLWLSLAGLFRAAPRRRGS